jgi:hypothetical protein
MKEIQGRIAETSKRRQGWTPDLTELSAKNHTSILGNKTDRWSRIT